MVELIMSYEYGYICLAIAVSFSILPLFLTLPITIFSLVLSVLLGSFDPVFYWVFFCDILFVLSVTARVFREGNEA